MTLDRLVRTLRSPGMVLFTLILGTTLPLADTTSMNVGRFFIARGLDSTPDETRWLTAGYSLFVALGVPLSYRLRGLFEESALYILATAVFMSGSVISMLSHFMPMMMVGRALQGLSGGILIPLSLSLIAETFSPERRGRALALFAVGNALAVSLGPTLGGLLVDTVGWRWTMGVHLPVGFLTILLASLSLENHPRPEKIPFDLSGWLLFSATGFFTMYTLMEGERFGWHSDLIEGTALLSLALLFSYLLHAARHPRPILPPDLLRHGGYLLLTGANFLRSTAIFGRLYLLPLYLEIYYHFQSHQAGAVIFVGAITELLIPVFGIFLLPRKSAFTWGFMAAGSLVIALSNLAYLLLPGEAYVPALVLFPQMLFGLGVALTQVSLQPLVVRTLPPLPPPRRNGGPARGAISRRDVRDDLGPPPAEQHGAALSPGAPFLSPDPSLPHSPRGRKGRRSLFLQSGLSPPGRGGRRRSPPDPSSSRPREIPFAVSRPDRLDSVLRHQDNAPDRSIPPPHLESQTPLED